MARLWVILRVQQAVEGLSLRLSLWRRQRAAARFDEEGA